MLCKHCGKTPEKNSNIISLCCPYCEKPYESDDTTHSNTKKGKISHITPPKNNLPQKETPQERFRDLEIQAEDGDGESIFALATAHFHGEGTPVNMEKAFQYFLESAKLGDIDGIFQTGMAYFQGKGVELDLEKAFEFFLKAAEENYPKGYIMLGIYYTSATSSHYKPEEGVKYLEKGAIHEADSAAVPLAICYSQGIGVELDMKKALHWLNVGLQHDNEVAMYHYAAWQIKGEVMPQDYAKAISLLKKSCDLNCPESCYLLAQCYFCGAGVLENWSLAIRYTRKGDQILQRRTPHIDQLDFYVHPLFLPGFGIPELENLVEAGTSIYIQYALGELYEQAGEQQKAIDIYHQCEEANLPQALFKLGEYYVNLGEDTLEKGVSYYEKSAKFHYAPALCAIGHCYEEGISLQKNLAFAYFHYQKSALQDYGLGNFHLGRCHKNGISVEQNPKKAEHYFKKSLEQGYQPAKEFL